MAYDRSVHWGEGEGGRPWPMTGQCTGGEGKGEGGCQWPMTGQCTGGGAAGSGSTGLPISLCRAFVQLDMKAIFAETPPLE